MRAGRGHQQQHDTQDERPHPGSVRPKPGALVGSALAVPRGTIRGRLVALSSAAGDRDRPAHGSSALGRLGCRGPDGARSVRSVRGRDGARSAQLGAATRSRLKHVLIRPFEPHVCAGSLRPQKNPCCGITEPLSVLAGLADGLAPKSSATHTRLAPTTWVPRFRCATSGEAALREFSCTGAACYQRWSTDVTPASGVPRPLFLARDPGHERGHLLGVLRLQDPGGHVPETEARLRRAGWRILDAAVDDRVVDQAGRRV